MPRTLSLKNAKQAMNAILAFDEHYGYSQDRREFGITFTDYTVLELLEIFEPFKSTKSAVIQELWANYKNAYVLLSEYQLIDDYGEYVINPDYKYMDSLENYIMKLY